jgi:hypothetical protein
MRYASVEPAMDATSGRLATGGERRLMLAVLEDALRTLSGARLGRTNPTWIRRELDWFTSTERGDPFTFERLCEALEIDASWLRQRVLGAYWRVGARSLLRASPPTEERTIAGLGGADAAPHEEPETR